MQALTHALGGQVDPSAQREYGQAEIIPQFSNSPILQPFDDAQVKSLLSSLSQVWMSHGDRINKLPEGFTVLASSKNSPFAAMGDVKRKYFGVQFHPESFLTEQGTRLLQNFLEIPSNGL